MEQIDIYKRDPKLDKLYETKSDLQTSYFDIVEYIETSEQGLIFKLQSGPAFYSKNKEEQLQSTNLLVLKLVNYIKTSREYQEEFEKRYSDITNKLFLLEEADRERKKADMEINKEALFAVGSINTSISEIMKSSESSSEKIITKDKEIESLKEREGRYNKALNRFKTQNDSLLEEKKALEEELSYLKELQIETKAYDMNHILKELARYKSAYVSSLDLRNVSISLEKENERLKSKNNRLENVVLKSLDDIFSRLKNVGNKQDIQDTIDLLEGIMGDLNNEIKTLKEQIEEKNKIITEKDERIRFLEERLLELQETKNPIKKGGVKITGHGIYELHNHQASGLLNLLDKKD